MKYKSEVIIVVLLLIIGGLLYDKITTQPKTTPTEQKQTPVVEESKNLNKSCMIAAENFFEIKRSKDIELYSATWNEYYDESSGTCFVEIRGVTYDVTTGNIVDTPKQ